MGSVASRAERQATDRLLLGDHAPGNWRHWALGSSPQLEWGLCSGKYSGFRRNEIPPHSSDIQILFLHPISLKTFTLDAELRQYYWTPSILFMCSLILLLQDYISSRIGRWVSTLDIYYRYYLVFTVTRAAVDTRPHFTRLWSGLSMKYESYCHLSQHTIHWLLMAQSHLADTTKFHIFPLDMNMW